MRNDSSSFVALSSEVRNIVKIVGSPAFLKVHNQLCYALVVARLLALLDGIKPLMLSYGNRMFASIVNMNSLACVASHKDTVLFEFLSRPQCD